MVTAAGTSGANYLAFATLLDPGDEVLIEHPTYGLLVDALEYVGAVVKRFARTHESGYAVEAEAVRRAVTPQTKLIVVTNLHNPSSVLTGESVLREIGEIARSVGARVLVDEVYLDAVYENTPRTSFHLGAEFVVTSSLTKVYGVSGLRCGWILAEAELARAMWRMNDLFAATPVHPGELLSVAVFGTTGRGAGTVPPDCGGGPKGAGRSFWIAREAVSAVRTRVGDYRVSAPGGRRRGRVSGATAGGTGDVGGAGTVLRDAGVFSGRHGREFGDVRRGSSQIGRGALKNVG